MNLEDLQKLASEIDDKYAEMGAARGFQDRTPLFYLGCLMTDLGELTELIMIKEKYRDHKDNINIDAKIEHELSDCLWAILILAKQLKVDLPEVFPRMIEDVKKRQLEDKAG